MNKNAAKVCACGCGQPVRRTYVHGHNNRGKDLKGPLGPNHFTIVDAGHDTTCWIWNGRKHNRGGYGLVWKAGRSRMAHRVMYQQAGLTVPDGLQLDHLCKNKACVRPDHLEPVTGAVNVRRGRRAKLTPEIVRAIRDDTTMSGRQWAAVLGVSPSAVWHVRSNDTWRGV